MAKSKNSPTIWGELLSVGVYKRNQGRLTRQLTFLALSAVVGFGTWTVSQGALSESDDVRIRIGIPFVIFVVCEWVVYRLVNYPRFSDFLISVEAEVDKVTWSSRQELIQATIVVVITMFLMGVVLFVYDFLWQNFFSSPWIRFLQIVN